MIGAAVALGLVLAVAPGASDRHHLAEVSLVGPIDEVRFGLGSMGETVVRGPLAAGERRTVVVPLPAWGETAGLVPEIEERGAGQAAFLGWVEDEGARAWSALSSALRRRARPAPPELAPTRAPIGALCVAAAAVLAGWSLRERRLAAVLVCALGAGGTFALVGPRAGPAVLRVLEGDGASGDWFEVDALRGRASSTGREELLRVECRPERARLHYEVALAGGGRPGWTLAGEGCELFLLRPAAPGTLTPEANRLADLAEAWVRAADGSGWTAVGAWPKGTALPTTGQPADPPGGLNPALPLGSRVLVGRLEAAAGAAGAEAWVRLVGLGAED